MKNCVVYKDSGIFLHLEFMPTDCDFIKATKNGKLVYICIADQPEELNNYRYGDDMIIDLHRGYELNKEKFKIIDRYVPRKRFINSEYSLYDKIMDKYLLIDQGFGVCDRVADYLNFNLPLVDGTEISEVAANIKASENV